MTDRTRMVTSSRLFQLNKTPIAERSPGLDASSGQPPSSVPLGQMYLQNHGSPIPAAPSTVIGRMMTNSTSTT